MVQRRDQSMHDRLVGKLVAYAINAGFFDLKADLIGFVQPDAIHWTNLNVDGHIPDVSATKDNVPFIFEVETDDTVTDAHTVSQWKLFAAHAINIGGKFVIVVPTNSKLEAERHVAALGITAEVWS